MATDDIPDATANGTKPATPTFFGLPRELRDDIYDRLHVLRKLELVEHEFEHLEDMAKPSTDKTDRFHYLSIQSPISNLRLVSLQFKIEYEQSHVQEIHLTLICDIELNIEHESWLRLPSHLYDIVDHLTLNLTAASVYESDLHVIWVPELILDLPYLQSATVNIGVYPEESEDGGPSATYRAIVDVHDTIADLPNLLEFNLFDISSNKNLADYTDEELRQRLLSRWTAKGGFEAHTTVEEYKTLMEKLKKSETATKNESE